jgi:hypothetical protein
MRCHVNGNEWRINEVMEETYALQSAIVTSGYVPQSRRSFLASRYQTTRRIRQLFLQEEMLQCPRRIHASIKAHI